jgi:hypothetical protein
MRSCASRGAKSPGSARNRSSCPLRFARADEAGRAVSDDGQHVLRFTQAGARVVIRGDGEGERHTGIERAGDVEMPTAAAPAELQRQPVAVVPERLATGHRPKVEHGHADLGSVIGHDRQGDVGIGLPEWQRLAGIEIGIFKESVTPISARGRRMMIAAVRRSAASRYDNRDCVADAPRR